MGERGGGNDEVGRLGSTIDAARDWEERGGTMVLTRGP